MSTNNNKQTLRATKNVGAIVKDWMSLVGIALLIVVFSIISYAKFGAQYFLTWSNWKTILLQSSTVAIVALGQSIMLLTGNFDLSLGRMVCLTSCVGAVLMKNVGMNTGLAIVIMFAIGLTVGLINGLMVAYVGVPAMIATLGTQYICYGVAKLLTQAVPIPKMPDSIAWMGRGYILNGTIPVCVILMLVLYIVAQFITSKTKVGRNLYAVGGSREAAFFSGINVKLYQLGTFLLGGVLATFGGLVLMSRLNSVAVTNGQNYEFDAVISSIIGGVSLAGGKGRVIGTMFGCIFLNTLFNGFSQMGVDPFVQDVLKGVVLVLAVTLDVASNKKKS
ncbi:MAG: ABC transporter permease [Clostridiales bacterium]|nr:ABC transporter permease [Clostridiales bacterium]